MKGGSFKEVQSATCGRDQPALSSPSSSTHSVESRVYESNREATKPERVRIWKPGIQEKKAIPPFPGFMDSRLSPNLFLRSYSAGLFCFCRCCHWFKEIHGILRTRRNRETRPHRCGNSDGAPSGDGRNNYSVGSTERRPD